MLRVTVGYRITEYLSCRFQSTLSNIQSATILEPRDHFHHFRGFDLVNRTCTQSRQNVGFHFSFDSIGVALAFTDAPMCQPCLGNGLERVFVVDVVFVFLGLPICHRIGARSQERSGRRVEVSSPRQADIRVFSRRT